MGMFVLLTTGEICRNMASKT